MAAQAKYTAVANALLKVISGDIEQDVPSWARGMIPANIAPEMAGQLAKVAVDEAEAFDAANAPKDPNQPAPGPTPEQVS